MIKAENEHKKLALLSVGFIWIFSIIATCKFPANNNDCYIFNSSKVGHGKKRKLKGFPNHL